MTRMTACSLALAALATFQSSATAGPEELKRKPFLGAQLAPADDGVAVRAVVPGSTAEEVGLEAGDVIRAVDGSKVASPPQLVERVGSARTGDSLALEVARGGETLKKTAILKE